MSPPVVCGGLQVRAYFEFLNYSCFQRYQRLEFANYAYQIVQRAYQSEACKILRDTKCLIVRLGYYLGIYLGGIVLKSLGITNSGG